MTDYNDGEWHTWNGGKCPVGPDVRVRVEFLDGYCFTDRAGNLSWENSGDRFPKSTIISFRVCS